MIIEIKTFALGSRIRDVALWDEPNIESVPEGALAIVFLAGL